MILALENRPHWGEWPLHKKSPQNRSHTGLLVSLLLCFFLVFFLPGFLFAGEWDPLATRLVVDGFPESWINGLFARPEAKFDPSIMARKMRTLHAKKFGTEFVRRLQRRLTLLGYKPGSADGKLGSKTRRAIQWFQKAQGVPVDGKATLELLQMALREHKKAPVGLTIPSPKPGPLVYKTIMTPEVLGEAEAFYKANNSLLLRVERRYGVPGEIVVGILTVETRVGKYLGEKSAFLTLASMALCRDIQHIEPYFKDESFTKKSRRWLKRRTEQKAQWAYEECKALLSYARAINKDPLTLPGSFYGAIGIGQFMPTKVLEYGVDGNHDGVVDVFALEDALFSVGNYLRANGWRGTMKSRKRQRRAVFNYNYSKIYVNTVMAVADYLDD